jgi:DNA-binding CsgD family transcriptional regulator
MSAMSTTEQVRQEIMRLCYAGLDSRTLRIKVFDRLQRAIPYVAFWCGTTDPETLLITGTVMQGLDRASTPAFITNELLGNDANQFAELAKRRVPVSTLYIATRGDLRRSQRFREILEPSGQGNELRAALRSGRFVWGAVCLHRELRAPDFSPAEVQLLSHIAPHLAAGLRTAALLGVLDEHSVTVAPVAEGPGLVMLADDLSVVGLTPAAEWWLSEIGDWPRGGELPVAIYAVATRLQTIERLPQTPVQMTPRARVRTRSGQWLAVHASRLAGSVSTGQIAVILEPARPPEVASLALLAYALTEREAQVAQLVLKGYSTVNIAATLTISDLTVQEHLKAVFDKVGVRSRRELVAQFFAQNYWPHLASDMGVAPHVWSAKG